MFFRTPKEMREYEAREKYDMDIISAEDNGRVEGRAEASRVSSALTAAVRSCLV